ncbi:MAG TPA: NADH-quinone oxidoreductase subunit A [Armatimonadota bacterium]|nr:NADH-quinone oxidoreductase subunit A [Armatimonadota bacterium]
MTNQAISIAVFLGLGVVFWMVALAASYVLRPHRPTAAKETTYECGTEPIGRAWYQVHVRYYIYALLFVLFDVEVAFLYPWAVVYRRLSGFHVALFVEVVIFLAVLIFGLVYVWRKGALEWE